VIDAAGDGARHRTRLEVTLDDGRVLRSERDHAKGSARQPIERADVEEKYRRLAEKALAPDRVTGLAALVDRLDTLNDIGVLVDHLEGASS
jgi:aconitate decarboxylase